MKSKYPKEIQNHSKDKAKSKNSKVMRKSLRFKGYRYKNNNKNRFNNRIIKRVLVILIQMWERISICKTINKIEETKSMMIMIVSMIQKVMIPRQAIEEGEGIGNNLIKIIKRKYME